MTIYHLAQVTFVPPRLIAKRSAEKRSERVTVSA